MAQQTFSGVPGDFSAGQVLTAADMDKLREFLLYLIKDGDETDTGEVSPLILDLGNDRVGINTVAPTAPLSIDVASADGEKVWDVQEDGSTSAFWLTADFAGAGAGGNSVAFESLWTADILTMMGDGTVGVGAAPSLTHVFQVQSTGTVPVCRFTNTDSTVTASNQMLVLQYTADTNCDGGYYCLFGIQGAWIGSIACDSINSVAFNTSSDYRIKSNVADLTDAVASVEALRPITFSWTRDTQQRTYQGFLAHEVAEVYPGAVTGEKDAMQTVAAVAAVEAVEAVEYAAATYDDDGNELTPEVQGVEAVEAVEAVPEHEVEDHQMMDASKLVPLLTAAVRELSARVAALEAAV